VAAAEHEAGAAAADGAAGVEGARPRVEVYVAGALTGRRAGSRDAVSDSFSPDGPRWTAGARVSVPLDLSVLRAARAGHRAEAAAAATITVTARMGIPVSTTHTIGTAIMGVGATRRFSAVNWSVSRQIVNTWVLTFPACLILGYGFALVFKAF